MYSFLLIFSACLGSFSSACIYRYIHNEDFFMDRSRCPHCHHTLAWWHLLPIISYVVLRGKCYYCHKKISFLYPLNECFHILIFYLLFYFTHDFFNTLLWGSYFSMCLNLSIIDIKTQHVPTILLCILLIIIVLLNPLTRNTILITSIVFLMLCIMYYSMKHHFGFGDVLYITLHALLLHPIALCKAIFSSCILALLFLLCKKRNQLGPIPFIPFLSIGFFIQLLFIF